MSGGMKEEVRKLREALELLNAVLRECKVLLMPRGTVEASYAGWHEPTVDLNDGRKREAFEEEHLLLESASQESIASRYGDLLGFFEHLTQDSFDMERYVKIEVEKIMARLQSILLEEEPSDLEALSTNPRFVNLKIADFMVMEKMEREGDAWLLSGKSYEGFTPEFSFVLDTAKGIQRGSAIRFVADEDPQG